MTKAQRITDIRKSLEGVIQILNLTTPEQPQVNIILVINAIHQVRCANASLETLKDEYEKHPNAI